MTDHTEMRETMREVLELAVSDANRYSSREPVRLRAVVALRWDHPWLSVFAACALIDAVRVQERRERQMYLGGAK